ncbi:MAG: aminotransferase class V-fold PLP-dependent enzyme [Pseudomonadota bacterium]
MSAADHRRLFAQAAELASRFRDGVADRPPWAPLSGAALQTLFDGPTPEFGEDPESVIDALNAAAEPGLAGSTGPRFFGWVIGASDPVGVAADILTSAWGQNGGSAACSPSAAMAEKIAAKWLLDLLHLPQECSVGFVSGATMANFTCLAAARNAVLARVGWDVEADGLGGAPRIRVFLGDDAHTTILAGLRYLGLGTRATRIRTDDEGRMDPAALAAALAEGSGPAIVIAQAGQINTGAFDPVADIARISRQHGAWLHVDGAFGLWAMAVPEFADRTAGIAAADSWGVDGHKWLQLPYDSAFAIVRDVEAHQRAMSITASYLPPSAAGEHDPGQFVPELSRRARGFAVWAQLRALGRQGVVAMVRQHCALARRLADRLTAESGITVLNIIHLNQVIVNFGTGSPAERSATTHAVIERLHADNICLAGGADWRGQRVLRLSIISAPLVATDIDRLVAAVLSAWRHVQRETATRPAMGATASV